MQKHHLTQREKYALGPKYLLKLHYFILEPFGVIYFGVAICQTIPFMLRFLRALIVEK